MTVKLIFWTSVLGVLSFLLTLTVAPIQHNLSAVVITHVLGESKRFDSDTVARTQAWLQQTAAQGDSSSTGEARRASYLLGFLRWYKNEDEDAFQAWRKSGMTAVDYTSFGRAADNQEAAMRWYRLAIQAEPEHDEAWVRLGLICQQYLLGRADEQNLCARFWARNKQNLLVDMNFEYDRLAWTFNRRAGAAYAIAPCPKQEAATCASVTIGNEVPAHGASWQQCLRLEPGQEYEFSAWLKVDTMGEWEPLYFQGNMGGQPNGYWPSTQQGSSAWSHWTQTFTAPAFDHERACFHPVRLQASGTVWFYGATLRPVS